MFVSELVAVRVEDWKDVPVQSLHHCLILQHLHREEVSWCQGWGLGECTSPVPPPLSHPPTPAQRGGELVSLLRTGRMYQPLILHHLHREEVSWCPCWGQGGCTSLSSSTTCTERRLAGVIVEDREDVPVSHPPPPAQRGGDLVS